VSHEKATLLPLLLWSVFLFWQLFPVMATAFTENLDSSDFLRFPLSYSSYFFIQLAYGSFDPATAVGSLWLLGITIGIAVARTSLAPWTVLVLFTFAVVNILLARLIFAWVERWLARRRSRELMGILFFLMVIGLQFVGPLLGHYSRKPNNTAMHIAQEVTPVQRVLPPGMAAQAISSAILGPARNPILFYLLLCAYGIGFAAVLHIRLHAQYRGESLSETAASSAPASRERARSGFQIPGLPNALSAMLEKEFRYLFRSGPMLFTMLMPIVMLMIFRLGPGGASGNEGFLVRMPALAFPVGTMYALLMLTNMIYNNFGADAGGIQFYFASPVSFRSVIAAKNLTHTAVLFAETILVWFAVGWFYRQPPPDVTLATLAGILFALPVNLAAGNLLSVYSPKRVEYGTFGRQRASWTTVLCSFGIQFATFGLAGMAVVAARRYGNWWISALILFVASAPALTGYWWVMGHIDGIASRQKETLITELCRA
jgi:ABC-2 type transport system permease protein